MDGSATETELQGNVAVLRLALSREGRITAETLDRLSRDLDEFAARDGTDALILGSSAGRFAVGGDHADLIRAGAVRKVAELADRIEALDCPTLAAIDGACLGYGAELALAADFRVAHVDAQIGFTDVQIGLPPVAGATIRLPRILGADPSLKLMLTGQRLTGREAQKVGLVDLVLDGDTTAAAMEFIRKTAAVGDAQPRRVEETGAEFLAATARQRANVAGAALEAPQRIVELVEAGHIVPPEIFRNMEEVAFTDLWDGDHARALLHMDEIERSASRLQRMIKPKSREVTRAAVASTRGQSPGIAIGLLDSGYDVTVAEAEEETLEAGVTGIIEHYDRVAAAGQISEEAVEGILDRLHALAGFRTLGEADLVFDVVNQRGAASKTLITQLDGAMKAGAVLATGATQVGPDTIGAITSRPGDVVAVRFFGPMAERRAVEVAPGTKTDAMALGTVLSVLRQMRRLPIVTAPNTRGIGARLMASVHVVADHLLEHGASIALIDGVARAWGLPLGSFAARDQHGIVAPSPKTADPAASLGLDRVLASQGRRGRVTGKGYYDYTGGQIAHDADVNALVDALRQRKGITPRIISPEEIRLSLIATMANTGAAILAEGALARPAQIDLLTVHGLGLSRRAGGAMHSADTAGLERVRARLKALSEENEHLPGPHPMFQKLMKSGQRFSDLNTPSQ